MAFAYIPVAALDIRILTIRRHAADKYGYDPPRIWETLTSITNRAKTRPWNSEADLLGLEASVGMIDHDTYLNRMGMLDERQIMWENRLDSLEAAVARGCEISAEEWDARLAAAAILPSDPIPEGCLVSYSGSRPDLEGYYAVKTARAGLYDLADAVGEVVIWNVDRRSLLPVAHPAPRQAA